MRITAVAAVGAELGPLAGRALGVGPVVAGVRAGVLLERLKPEAVVLVGTAGRYPGGPSIGSVIRASPLGLAEVGSRAGLGYTPMAPETIHPGPWFEADVRASSVLTLPAITTDATVADAFAREGWEVEHMETYAVAWACREAGVPFAAMLGITNDVGPDAHTQWLANRDVVQDAVRAELLRALLAAGHVLASEPEPAR